MAAVHPVSESDLSDMTVENAIPTLTLPADDGGEGGDRFDESDKADAAATDGSTPHHKLLCSRWRGPCQCCFIKGAKGIGMAAATTGVTAAAVLLISWLDTGPWASRLLALLALVLMPGLGPGPAGPGPFRMCGGVVFHVLSLLRAYNTLEPG